MKFEEISEKAFREEGIGECKNIAEKYAYLQLVILYRDFSKKKIDKEAAKRQKIKIEREYEENLLKVNKYYDIFKEQTEVRRKYHDYLVSIEKSKTQDDILINSLKFIEVVVQDKSFFDRNYNKIN